MKPLAIIAALFAAALLVIEAYLRGYTAGQQHPDLDACEACGTELAATDVRFAAGPSVLCRRCPKPAGAVALSAGDRDALASFAHSEPSTVVATPESVRPDGALDRLLRSALEAFAERSFRTYRHLRAATRGGRAS